MNYELMLAYCIRTRMFSGENGFQDFLFYPRKENDNKFDPLVTNPIIYTSVQVT